MLITRRTKLALFVLIFLIAAAGRIINIDNESLWVDEGFSYWTLRQPNVKDMMDVILRDVHPPTYFFMLRGWSQLTGLSELALRYLSVLPSLLTVALVYHIARELERRRQNGVPYHETVVPILAALMMALADMENYIAQEARPYTWHVLWAAVSVLAFLRWARAGQRSWLIGWVVASILLLYTHYIGLCTIAVEGLYALLFLRKRRLVDALAAFAVIGVTFVPWLLVIRGQTENIGTGYNVPSTLKSLWEYRTRWFTQQWALLVGLSLLGLFPVMTQKWRFVGVHRDAPDPKPPTAQHLSFSFLLSPFSFAQSSVLSTQSFFASSFLMLSWFTIPIALTYALNWYTPILIDYRLTQITPAVALMVAFGLGYFRPPTLTFLVAVIVVYGVTIDDTHVEREPWREIGQNAARYAVSGDLAMAHITPSGDWQVIYYFDRMMPEGVDIRSLRQWQIEDPDSYPTGLPALLSVHPHIWFMHWSKDMSGFDALAATGHIQTALMTEDWLGNDLNVYRFDVVPPESQQLTAFTSGMVLRDAIIYPDLTRVDLWWSADAALDADYTVSAFLLDAGGQLVAQLDSYPFAGERPTTTWQPGEVIYDPHPLSLRPDLGSLPPGTYTVGIKIYLLAPDGSSGLAVLPTADGGEYFTIGTLER